MTELSNEIDANGEAFRTKWLADIQVNTGVLANHEKMISSYRRVTALQAQRTSLIQPLCPSDVTAFFIEAQNDALMSHVLASLGAWRLALKALRSCIEDVFGALYFKDHPIELQLWSQGKFKLGFSATLKYFQEHPKLSSISDGLNGLELLRDEYATLSKAVHGSAKNFRMTDEIAGILLWDNQLAKLGAWDTRHKRVLEAISLLTICMFADRLQGTANAHLRSVLGFVLGNNRRTQLREQLHIHIDAA